MFGLLNILFRPLGGFISDKMYHRFFESVTAKKSWLTALTVGSGVLCILIGAIDSKTPSVMIGLVAALAFFMDAANGANFGLVPHVFPSANGKLLMLISVSLGSRILTEINFRRCSRSGRRSWKSRWYPGGSELSS